MSRIQSPSSINLYISCPRKYYYCYIDKQPSKPSIYLVRGKIAHSVLEDFFNGPVLENYKDQLFERIKRLFQFHWDKNQNELNKLDLNEKELRFYHFETEMMLVNWLSLFFQKMEQQINNGLSVQEAFQKLTPQREVWFSSDKYQVQGYIDAIETSNGVRLMDYKTSKKYDMTDEYKLQLSIYALLYQEKLGQLPDRVGLYFLKGGEKDIPVDIDLVNQAKQIINEVHEKTKTDDIHAYLQNITPLCKWSTGQCDFYHLCFNKEKIKNNFDEVQRTLI